MSSQLVLALSRCLLNALLPQNIVVVAGFDPDAKGGRMVFE
ncbi:MAG: hypothetical protein O3B03_02525 [Proteobacteria bacterium]|nr:hypothetical protein [Pseudomonadota bacterium]MDA1331724.1 hypothetical protein [Pseudomonadota bacterium]